MSDSSHRGTLAVTYQQAQTEGEIDLFTFLWPPSCDLVASFCPPGRGHQAEREKVFTLGLTDTKIEIKALVKEHNGVAALDKRLIAS